MQAFILEILSGREWRRGGRIFWTSDTAQRESRRLISAGKAVAVRVLTAEVDLQPVASFPAKPEVGRAG